jgi:hypothetical protein
MENTKENLIHDLDEPKVQQPIMKKQFVVIIIGVIFVGFLSGFLLSKIKSGKTTGSTNKTTVAKSAGIQDKKTFNTNAEGILKEGGIEGEGNFHLLRPGGESQNVYLTSSTVDLSLYINKKIKVWGETFKGQKAGWLMDVGLVETE